MNEDDFHDAPKVEESTNVQVDAKEEKEGRMRAPKKADLVQQNVQLAADKARLEAEIAALREGMFSSTSAVTPRLGQYWRVRLEGAPTHVVQAPDSANAWVVYCTEMGVIGSIHQPTIDVSDREAYRAAQAKRRGLKPEEFRLPGDP